jgi:superfamily II DNA or RNA helicase
MTLKEKETWPKTSYHNKINNMATEFFNPALIESTSYKRIAGLFSSNSLALAARGISEFVKNEGKMELIISPILSKDDADAINNASKVEFERILSESLTSKLNLENEFERDHVFALKYLLKKNNLEIRIHIPKDELGKVLDSETIIEQNILAEKRGIFQDRDGHVVSFRGPIDANKESWERGNFEITVDVSWDDGQLSHVKHDIDVFDKLWDNLETKKLPESVKHEFIKNAPEKEQIDLKKYDVPEWAILSENRILWDNQIIAVNSWMNNKHRGIFTIATSGGKTLSAIVSANRLPKNVLTIVLVPLKDLAIQWEKEIKQYDPNAETIICDGDHGEWKEKLPQKLNKFLSRNEDYEIKNRTYVIVTASTAISKRKNEDQSTFLKNFRHINQNQIMVIGDEVHHYGSPKYREVFEISARYKLGLSATYRRSWDEEGTDEILNYFGRPLSEAEYSITQGIADNRLSQYSYHPFFTMLEQDEFEKYAKLSEKINKLHSNEKNSNGSTGLEEARSALLNQRADILKNARNKPRAYKEIIKSHPTLPYIVFGDDQKQVHELEMMHEEAIKEINSESEEMLSATYFEYSGRTKKEARKKILEQSVLHKRPIFAMYCLDEGIDVPEFSGAILVSSSRVKRQYIQRRGRILRKSKKEKIAQLYDIIVFPPYQSDIINNNIAEKIIDSEYERLVELSSDATNKYAALEKVMDFKKKIRYN